MDRNLLIRAAFLLLLTRCGLVLLGYARLRRLLSGVSRPHLRAPSECPGEVDRIIWAVSTTGAKVLRERPCLVIAMATHCLLSWRGVRTDLRIGAVRGLAGNLEAHAWVEQNGRVLIGQSPSLGRYHRLPAVNFWT